jgi:hypothetical protein
MRRDLFDGSCSVPPYRRRPGARPLHGRRLADEIARLCATYQGDAAEHKLADRTLPGEARRSEANLG